MKKIQKANKEIAVIPAAHTVYIKARRIIPIEIVIILLNLSLCILTSSFFLTSCSLYLIINAIVRYHLIESGNRYRKEEDNLLSQKKKHSMLNSLSQNRIYSRLATGSFLLLIVSFLLLGSGIMVFFMDPPVIRDMAGKTISVLSGIGMLITLLQCFLTRKFTDILMKSFRLQSYSNVMILFTLFISVTMYLFVSEDLANLVGITAVVFSLAAIGLTAYSEWRFILANEHNKSKYLHFQKNRVVIFTKLSYRKDIVVVLGKVILGCMSLSAFMFVNALYSAGVGLAKYKALQVQDKSEEEQIHSYYEIGAGILGAGICYMIYSFRMFQNGTSPKFNLVIALIIAMYTFTELFITIKDYCKARKSKNIISEELKLIRLSSILICVVLTQVAIMSFTHEGDVSFYNGISGVIFGGLSASVGGYMMLRSMFLKKSSEEDLHLTKH